jgi:hypothetical protein
MNQNLLAVIATVTDYAVKRGVFLPPDLDARIAAALKSEAYYERRLTTAIRRRYNEETSDDEFLLVMAFLIAQQLRRAYMEGLREAGVNEMDTGMQNELFFIQMEEEQYARKLLDDIKAAILAGAGWMIFLNRIQLWVNRYLDIINRGIITGGKRKNKSLIWELGATEKHCDDCFGYAGLVKPAQEWDDIYRVHGHRPQARALQCKGYNCDCRLRVV